MASTGTNEETSTPAESTQEEGKIATSPDPSIPEASSPEASSPEVTTSSSSTTPSVPPVDPDAYKLVLLQSNEASMFSRIGFMRSLPFNSVVANSNFGASYPCKYTTYLNNLNISYSFYRMGFFVDCTLVPNGFTNEYGNAEQPLNPTGSKTKISSCGGEDEFWELRIREEISNVVSGGATKKLGVEYVLYFQNVAVDGSDLDIFPDTYSLKIVGQEGHYLTMDGTHTRYRNILCADGSPIDPSFDFSAW
ncbi:MAG: hypothetical protein NTX25_03590 [Proteobacteria bacterium]|nr:hypothetical protein [Pseudomonadota bacterium]